MKKNEKSLKNETFFFLPGDKTINQALFLPLLQIISQYEATGTKTQGEDDDRAKEDGERRREKEGTGYQG